VRHCVSLDAGLTRPPPPAQGLSVEQAQVLARSVSVEHVARGKMFQLDTCDSLWTLRDGEARLMAPDPQV
jgi:hypothetical protein